MNDWDTRKRLISMKNNIRGVIRLMFLPLWFIGAAVGAAYWIMKQGFNYTAD